MIYFRTFGVAVIASIGILIALAMLLDRDTHSPTVEQLRVSVDGDSVGIDGAFDEQGVYRIFAPRVPPPAWYLYSEPVAMLADPCLRLQTWPNHEVGNGRLNVAEDSLVMDVLNDNPGNQGYYCYYLLIPADFEGQFLEVQVDGARHRLQAYRFERIPDAGAPIYREDVPMNERIPYHQYGTGVTELVPQNDFGPFQDRLLWLFDYGR